MDFSWSGSVAVKAGGNEWSDLILYPSILGRVGKNQQWSKRILASQIPRTPSWSGILCEHPMSCLWLKLPSDLTPKLGHIKTEVRMVLVV